MLHLPKQSGAKATAVFKSKRVTSKGHIEYQNMYCHEGDEHNHYTMKNSNNTFQD